MGMGVLYRMMSVPKLGVQGMDNSVNVLGCK